MCSSVGFIYKTETVMRVRLGRSAKSEGQHRGGMELDGHILKREKKNRRSNRFKATKVRTSQAVLKVWIQNCGFSLLISQKWASAAWFFCFWQTRPQSLWKPRRLKMRRKTPPTDFREAFHNPCNRCELWVILHASFVLTVLYTARKLFINAKWPFWHY